MSMAGSVFARVVRAPRALLSRQSQIIRQGQTASGSLGTQCSVVSIHSSAARHSGAQEGSASSEEDDSALEAFREIVMNRTAAHRFSDRKVEDSALRDIMALAMSAPSSFNVQPWSVVLVRDDDSRERLAATMLGGNAKKVQAAPVTAVFCADLEPSKRIQRMVPLNRKAGMAEDDISKLTMAINLFSGEGAVGNVVRNAVTTIASPLQPAPEVGSAEAWSFKNTALAAQTYILACTAHGLATAPMEGFDARRVRAALDIPDRYGIPMVVCTGYAAAKKDGEGGSSVKRWRYPPEEVVFDGKFGVGMETIEPVVP